MASSAASNPESSNRVLRLEPPTAGRRELILAGATPSEPLDEFWSRSATLGADAHGEDALHHAVVTEHQLAESRARLQPLREAATPILTEFFTLCDQRDYIGLLTDADGVVVCAAGGGSFGPTAEQLRLIEGGAWSEALRGTNAIGTALAEGRPTAVHGAAHYAAVNRELVCYATPIRDPQGEILAVLDATSFAHQAGRLDASSVVLAARAIESLLRERALGSVASQLPVLQSVLDRCPEPALIVATTGQVLRANRAARERADRFGWPKLPPTADGPTNHDRDWQPTKIEPLLGPQGRPVAQLIWFATDCTRHPAASESTRSEAEPKPDPFVAIIGTDPNIQLARQTARRIATTDLPILLLADTGTGKDLFARAIHAFSARAEAHLVAVNCAALAKDLVASELFGHAAGAFTGASKRGRDGRLAAANGGTLFLDEVADLPLDAQAMLLRVLENGTYHRVGEAVERTVDLRVIAATCRDLDQLVANGEFRSDLLYRIQGARLPLPVLAARNDLDQLIEYFLDRMAADRAPQLAARVRELLHQHPWPGNIRELESVLQYAIAMADGRPRIECHDLPEDIRRGAGEAPTAESGSRSELRDLKLEAMQRAVETTGGNIAAAARQLGVARSTIYRALRAGQRPTAP